MRLHINFEGFCTQIASSAKITKTLIIANVTEKFRSASQRFSLRNRLFSAGHAEHIEFNLFLIHQFWRAKYQQKMFVLWFNEKALTSKSSSPSVWPSADTLPLSVSGFMKTSLMHFCYKFRLKYWTLALTEKWALRFIQSDQKRAKPFEFEPEQKCREGDIQTGSESHANLLQIWKDLLHNEIYQSCGIEE